MVEDSYYSVIVIGSIEEARQLAFAVMESGTIYLGRSGHTAILRQAGADSSDAVGGGWVFLDQGKITLFSGSLGHAHYSAKGAIENKLRKYFRIA